MAILVTLLREDSIFHYKMERYSEITFGNHKKDTVYVSDMGHAQISVKWKKNGLNLSVKPPFQNPVQKEELFDQILVLDAGTRTAILICEAAGMSSQTLKLPYQCMVKIGRAQDNTVSILKRYVSGKHCIIRSEAGIINIEDLQSTNGVFVNGKRISKCKLKSGDTISLMNLRIHLKDAKLFFEDFGDALMIRGLDAAPAFYTEREAGTEQGSALKYRRSPRTQEQLPTEDITLASAPTRGQKFERSRGMLASLVGSGAMAVSSFAMGAASPALMAARAATLVMPVSSIVSQKGGNKRRKKKLEEYELLRQEKYFTYISEQKARIDAVAEQQRAILTRENPSPQECVVSVYELKRNLWERMVSDRDFLHVRIGMGYENLCVAVHSRNMGGSVQMEDDEIKEMSEQLIEETRIVDDIPSRVSLLENTSVGIVGNREQVIRLVKNMIVSLTVSHCFQEVRLVGIFDEEETQIWESLRWLPHIWDKEKQFRYLAFTKEDAHNLCEMFDETLRMRERELSKNNFGKKVVPSPYYVFIFGSKTKMEKEEIMNHLFYNTSEMGVTSLFLFDDLYSLPHDCRFIIDMNQDPCAYPRDEVNHKFFFTPDEGISDKEFDAFARQMSAVELDGFAVKEEIPNGITFLQGYGVESIEQLNAEERWKNNNPENHLAAPIGVLGGNKIFSLDIHEKEHGPHGLVAGTTGSGKSELLQTWILSMAVNYHPYDVVFVIIDYKGGGMANLLEPLPHVVGKITNISSNINRSLLSLQSEIKRRLVVFDAVGVNHIDKYQKLYRSGQVSEPLPHLVIVADEFAELKKEEPDFMNGLVKAARVGRSLGIHLVLATQKPSGVVDDQIWSNARFKLCLKVADAGDSREMLKKTDAAYITQSGRAYVQVGMDEYYDLFQSFWSGAPYLGSGKSEEKIGNQVRIVNTNGVRTKTVIDEHTRFKSETDELTEIIRYIAETAEREGIRPLSGPWLPELPGEISLLNDIVGGSGFDGEVWNGTLDWLQVSVGMYDEPMRQQQGVQYLNFAEDGHYGIYGAPSTGKTTLLKTVVFSLAMMYSPKDVNIYILDCGGWSMNVFSGLPHVGGVALDSEEEKFEKFEKLVLDEFDKRKELFLRSSVGSLAAYRETVSDELPAMVIAIDNFASLFDLYPDMEQLFVTVAREGATYGIYMIYTANSTSGIRFKVLQNIRGAVAFELTDRGDYATIVGRLEGMFLPKIVGRAFFKGNPPVEFQAAQYADGDSDMERVEKVRKISDEMNRTWQGSRPRSIPVMPESVTLDRMEQLYTVRNHIPVGMRYSDIQPACLDLSRKYCMAVCAEDEQEKSRMLCKLAMIISHKDRGDKIYVIDSGKGQLKKLQNIAKEYAVDSETDAVSAMINEIVDSLNERKRAQNQSRAQEESFDEEAFIASYEQICVFIDDIKSFVDAATDEDRNSMERICRLAEGLAVMVFAGGSGEDITRYNEIESLTQAIIGYQKGVTVGGAPSAYGFFKNSLKYSEKAVDAGEGNGYVFDGGSCERTKLADS